MKEKDLIVLHTVHERSAKDHFAAVQKAENRVSCPYVLDTDGTIYELYDPNFWSLHLKIKREDNVNFNDRRSIGIEICGQGQLRKKGDSLYSRNKFSLVKYCDMKDEYAYVKTFYRGPEYYTVLTDQQKVGLGVLVDHLCSRFGIKKKIADEKIRNEFDVPFYSKWQGICTHANFREDKYDISWDVIDKAWLGL
jgi:N-acetyl-anhydromuramyl-L-alanine amidase AmpD